jgi:hypothetical protein
VPFVHALDPNQRLVRLVPSRAMLAHTSDRMHLWTTLQELSGIDNPFVLAAERRLREQLTAEKDTALREQKVRLDAESRVREQAQLAEAVRNLVAHLTGITVPKTAPAPEAPLDTSPATAPPATAPNASPRGPAAPVPAAAAPEAAEEPPPDADAKGP